MLFFGQNKQGMKLFDEKIQALFQLLSINVCKYTCCSKRKLVLIVYYSIIIYTYIFIRGFSFSIRQKTNFSVLYSVFTACICFCSNHFSLVLLESRYMVYIYIYILVMHTHATVRNYIYEIPVVPISRGPSSLTQ